MNAKIRADQAHQMRIVLLKTKKKYVFFSHNISIYRNHSNKRFTKKWQKKNDHNPDTD